MIFLWKFRKICPTVFNKEVIKADIRSLETFSREFDLIDLIHAGYVLIHIPDYKQALKKIMSFLKPGGWIV